MRISNGRGTLAFSALALGFFFPLVAGAENETQKDEPLGFGASIAGGFYSDYIFRGKNVYDGISLQPSVTGFYDMGKAGLISANVWMHISGETTEPPEKYTELDGTISYEIGLGPIDLSVGHILYTFPGGTGRIKDSKEFFAGISADVLLHPYLAVYADYDEGDYQYYTLGMRQPIPVAQFGEGVELIPYVTFGLASNADDVKNGYIIYEEDGLEHIDVGLSSDIPYGKSTVSPSTHFSFGIDDVTKNWFWVGFDVGFDL